MSVSPTAAAREPQSPIPQKTTRQYEARPLKILHESRNVAEHDTDSTYFQMAW